MRRLIKTPAQNLETQIAEHAKNLFSYSLDAKVLLADDEVLNDAVTITLHGSGDNKEHGRNLHKNGYLQGPVLIFDFPDHDIPDWSKHDFVHSTFGTIDEILPLLFLLKQCLDFGINKISIYGFSAGGGALINTLAVLNSDKYASELERIGITQADRKQIIHSLSFGLMILDCPLRSVEELIAFRGASDDLVILAKKYRENNMVPIERLDGLQGLGLNILAYFKDQDEVLSGRDVSIYTERLKKFNGSGSTTVICAPSGNHHDISAPLWERYRELIADWNEKPRLHK
jgi:hypothetical protein